MNNNKYQRFLFERDLAKKLFNSTLDERRTAYKSLYGEFFERFPNIAFDPHSIVHNIEWQMRLLKSFLNNDAVFMEVGVGNCLLSVEVSKYVKQVIAYEVADAIPHIKNKPNNLFLKIFDGIDFSELNDSVDVIYNNQVFEHLHTEDTLHHVKQYYKMLKENGRIIIVTPHCTTGPHDISRDFSLKPEGFHMKEYTYKEIRHLLVIAGFKNSKGFIGHKRLGYFAINSLLLIALEEIYGFLPKSIRYKLKKNPILLNLFGIKIVAKK